MRLRPGGGGKNFRGSSPHEEERQGLLGKKALITGKGRVLRQGVNGRGGKGLSRCPSSVKRAGLEGKKKIFERKGGRARCMSVSKRQKGRGASVPTRKGESIAYEDL